MATLTVNGISVVRGSIRLPRVGVWHADLKLDSTADLSGGATIATDDGSFSLAGTVVHHGNFQGTLSVRLVGGAAGFAKALPPRAWQGVPLSLPLKDILSGAGEKLSASADAAVLATNLKTWVRLASSAGSALARLLEPVAASYRIVPDGSLWVGTDTFPAAPSVQFDLMDRYFGEGRVVIASERPFLMPGTTLTLTSATSSTAEPVSYVVHDIEPSSIRSEVWFEKAYS